MGLDLTLLIIFDEYFRHNLNSSFTFQIYDTTSLLPTDWNTLAIDTVFLNTSYLKILELSAPKNMACHFIGIFEKQELVGIALSQFLDLNSLESFGERDKCVKTAVRNFVFKNFCSHVLFIGNNMLTGQNAIALSSKTNTTHALQALKQATVALKKKYKSEGKPIHITTFKDFDSSLIANFAIPEFKKSYQFSTQPNMIFEIESSWKSEEDYVAALSKKYRDQYKRARKKAIGIDKRKMNLEEIIANEEVIYDLYFHVAKNAPFNTFFLTKNHFRVFKDIMKDKFLFYGYFQDGKLIGFNTLIKNGKSLDTYFLGYDDSIQREKMLYLNMLYDMIGYSINKGFEEIIFARTALEIKSSVGAKAVTMYGLMEHSTPLLNKKIGKIFRYLEPKTIWQERNPFQ